MDSHKNEVADRIERLGRMILVLWNSQLGLLAALAIGVYLDRKGAFESSDPDLPFFLHWKFFLLVIGCVGITMLIVFLTSKFHKRFLSPPQKE